MWNRDETTRDGWSLELPNEIYITKELYLGLQKLVASNDLDIKQEVYHVAVTHFVLFAFASDPTFGFGID